jgi:hypothetical protein
MPINKKDTIVKNFKIFGSGDDFTVGLLRTVNCITCPVVCGLGGFPFGKGAFAVLVKVNFVPGGSCEKSTRISARPLKRDFKAKEI